MIRIAIVEDHLEFREALSQLLNMAPEYQLTGSYINATDALTHISGTEHVVLLDINLPEMQGTDAIPHFKKINPETKIIMLTMLDDDDSVMQAILNGADGYLLKKTPPEQILSAIETCLQGGSPMTPGIAAKVLQLFKKHIPKKNNAYDLTKREVEILEHLVEGFDNQQIADKLFISIQTVRNHIRHIYEKLQVHSKSQAVVKALREGLV
jgi:DNA-binding NarL/FixJ family response regulator